MSKNNKYFMVGSDPEGFLFDNSGKLVSSLGVIPGDKHSPHKTTNGYVLPDNITAEFNSIPASNVEDFVRNHNLILRDLDDIIKPLNLNMTFIASVMASDDILSDERAREAGCSIDFNAWSMSINEVADYSNTSLRAAGGHLHISFDQSENQEVDNRIKFVRALDLVLGVPSILVDDDIDRRKCYGKAGSFRPKFKDGSDPYNGVEYRTLSNFWVRSEGLMRWAFNGVKKVYDNLDDLSMRAESISEEIINCINNSDKKAAIHICNQMEIEYYATN